jgi:glucuronoarabinoxylan endo-1,4-beta-xylanase
MKKNLLAFFASALLFTGCSKKEASEQQELQAMLKGTATINASTVQQTIDGFGGASILAWQADLTSTQRTKAFSASSGIGMSILRVMVPDNSANFAAQKPTIDAAKSYGAKVIATAWTAPPSMMTGTKLNTSSYSAYAAHLKAFNTAVGGVYAISPTNEPNIPNTTWISATATEVANFVAQEGSNCGAPIMAPEPWNMDQTFINTYLSNATAKSKTRLVVGHIYSKTPYNLGSIGKPVWMTEHYTSSSVSGNDWPNAMKAAKEIHDCMNAGYAAYVWWYIRRSYGPIDESSNVTKVGYVMTHFAKWVRPGYTKISCTSNPTPGVYVTAYKSGSKLVVVIVNQNSAVTYQPFSFSGITIAGFNRYVTSSSSNLGSSSFAVSGGSFGINLAGSSVTTLVSN